MQRKTPLSPQLSDLAVKDISHIFLALITLIEKKSLSHYRDFCTKSGVPDSQTYSQSIFIPTFLCQHKFLTSDFAGPTHPDKEQNRTSRSARAEWSAAGGRAVCLGFFTKRRTYEAAPTKRYSSD